MKTTKPTYCNTENEEFWRQKNRSAKEKSGNFNWVRKNYKDEENAGKQTAVLLPLKAERNIWRHRECNNIFKQ